MTSWPIKCADCGKFLSKEEMGGKAKCEYTPDSHRSREEILWLCSRCADAEDAVISEAADARKVKG